MPKPNPDKLISVKELIDAIKKATWYDSEHSTPEDWERLEKLARKMGRTLKDVSHLDADLFLEGLSKLL